MTETPKCPYCGGNMEPHSIHGNQGGELSWYSCQKCEAISPNKKTKEAAISAALRRAEPENRVLTLEETKAHCAKGPDAEPLWVEYDTVRDMALWVLANTPYGMDEKDIPSIAYWLKDEELVSEYGKFWRCWLRKPTAEEMEREKWRE